MTIAAAYHDIPCTFTSKIRLQASYGEKKYLYNYTQYSINNKMMAQEGFIPQGYPLASSKIVYKARTAQHKKPSYTIIDPMFDDHLACAILPVTPMVFPCFVLPDSALVDQRNIECPKTSPYYGKEHCDTWTYYDIQQEGQVTWYFITDTFNPVQMEIDSDYFYELYEFLTFDTNEPPSSAFEPPSGIPCNDLTVDPTTETETILDTHGSYFAGFRGASVKSSTKDVTLVNDKRNIAKINAKAKTWKAGSNKVFDGMTFYEIANTKLRAPTPVHMGNFDASRNYFGAAPRTGISRDSIPESFDASKQWPNCDISGVGDQEQCGSCWAFGSTLSLGNRFCIAGNYSAPLRLSPQYAVSCFENLNGCEGGYTDIVWLDLMETGTVEESCVKYKGRDTECPRKCENGKDMKIYKSKDAYALYSINDPKSTMEKIQMDIMANGPVEAAFWVFDDFMNYQSGVYKRTPNSSFGGGHAVRIYGWGVDKETGLPYWLIANSWGPEWGENGSFRMLRGSNECSIEDSVAAGRPLF